MGFLRTSSIIYSDLELVTQLHGLSLLGYVDMLEAASHGERYPLLYDTQTRIAYVREPAGSEVWQSPRFTLAARAGDCEDLSAGYRVPELWCLGETAARPYVRRISARLRHILVLRADGTLEDPSLILGMHRERDPSMREAFAELARVKPPIITDNAIPFDLPRFADYVQQLQQLQQQQQQKTGWA